jgi:hypothetical protein
MNKHAIVILYSGKAQDPGCDTIEQLANVIVSAQLSVPELIEIKHFDSDSISNAIISKSTKVDSVETDLIKQSIIYFVEKYKHLLPPRRGVQILTDALHVYNHPVTEPITQDQVAFRKAMDTIVSNQTKAMRAGMSKSYIEMITYAYEVVKDL